MERESMNFDVIIVGAGISGLSCAIKIKQLCRKTKKDISVCVIEKGAYVGAHILSGAVMDPIALNELFPDWKKIGAPLNVLANEDKFLFFTQKHSISLPIPHYMKNKQKNYIISLGNVCLWLAKQAESYGVEIYCGFAASEILFNTDGSVKGIATSDMGKNRDGTKSKNYQQGIELHAQYTIFAEGCRGSLSEQIIKKFNLRKDSNTQTYGIGFKELWEIDGQYHKKGLVQHTIGWPLDTKTYGGSFLYHLDNKQISVGFVIGLDYQNPSLSPFEEFQRFKTHPSIRKIFENGRRIAYGARALNEGGLQSIPNLVFPGGCLVGCSAGFMNVPKLKGSHTAMKSGMLAGQAVFESLIKPYMTGKIKKYLTLFKKSWAYSELYNVRNIRPSFAKWGLWGGLIYSAIDTYLLRGKAPWTFKHQEDHKSLQLTINTKKIIYSKPDNKITFNKLSSIFLSNIYHKENQPIHLLLKDTHTVLKTNISLYNGPEQHFCPAGVYEFINTDQGLQLKINYQNCIHCKTCDIKDPTQNIVWIVPEGGSGPNYSNM